MGRRSQYFYIYWGDLREGDFVEVTKGPGKGKRGVLIEIEGTAWFSEFYRIEYEDGTISSQTTPPDWVKRVSAVTAASMILKKKEEPADGR